MKPAISDHQQSWAYEDGPWKGPGPPLLVAADFQKEMWFKVPLPINTRRMINNFSMYLIEFVIIVKKLQKALHFSN